MDVHDLRLLSDLQTREFPPRPEIVPGLVPVGLSVWIAPPKGGKSTLARHVAFAVANGGTVFGSTPVEPSRVLFVDLEESEGLLKKQMNRQVGDEEWPKNFIYISQEASIPRLPRFANELDQSILDEVKGVRLVLIDVLAAIAPEPEGGRGLGKRLFNADYDSLRPLKLLADRRGIAIVVLHHTRKMSDPDFVQEMSGTNGLAACADTIVRLKRVRTQNDVELLVTGRDIEERSIRLRFEGGRFTVLSGAEAAEFGLSEGRREILAYVREHGPAKPQAIAEALGRRGDTTRQTLRRMLAEGQLAATDGLYSIPPSDTGNPEQVSPLSPLEHLRRSGGHSESDTPRDGLSLDVTARDTPSEASPGLSQDQMGSGLQGSPSRDRSDRDDTGMTEEELFALLTPFVEGTNEEVTE
jgi:AAA domain-containing protein